MEPEQYRDQYIQQLASTAAPVDPLSVLLAKEQPTMFSAAKMRTAFESGPENPSTKAQDLLNRAVQLIKNIDADLELRSAALYTVGNALNQEPDLLGLLLERLADANELLLFRHAILTQLQQARFSSVTLRKRRADFLETLRGMVDEEDDELRLRVLENLAQEQDEFAQRRLLMGLEQADVALVPPEKAIQLLGYDIHAEYYPLLREIVLHPPNQMAKQEAIRLLAADPTAVPLLQELAHDKAEDSEVRRQCIIALQSLAPDAFETEARAIALDDTDDESVRATCINGLGYFGNGATLQQDRNFNEQLTQLQKTSGSSILEQAVQSYKAQQSQKQ